MIVPRPINTLKVALSSVILLNNWSAYFLNGLLDMRKNAVSLALVRDDRRFILP